MMTDTSNNTFELPTPHSSLWFLPAPCCCCCWWMVVLLTLSTTPASLCCRLFYQYTCNDIYYFDRYVYSICPGMHLPGPLTSGGESRICSADFKRLSIPTILFHFNDESNSDLYLIIQMFLHYLLACRGDDLQFELLDQLIKSQWGEWWEKISLPWKTADVYQS